MGWRSGARMGWRSGRNLNGGAYYGAHGERGSGGGGCDTCDAALARVRPLVSRHSVSWLSFRLSSRLGASRTCPMARGVAHACVRGEWGLQRWRWIARLPTRLPTRLPIVVSQCVYEPAASSRVRSDCLQPAGNPRTQSHLHSQHSITRRALLLELASDRADIVRQPRVLGAELLGGGALDLEAGAGWGRSCWPAWGRPRQNRAERGRHVRVFETRHLVKQSGILRGWCLCGSSHCLQ